MRSLIALSVMAVTMYATSTANAATLRLQHKPFNRMSKPQLIHFLRLQIHHDKTMEHFLIHHPQIKTAEARIALRWVRKNLPIAQKNLSKLTFRTASSVPALICRIFGPNCAMALLVAKRESGYCTCAMNGQYLGIFQMGSAERARFATIGYSTAYQQIIAAHNYFLVSGWGPWSQTAY